jgi:trigger factor
MQVRIEEVSAVEKKMFIEIPWEVVSAKLGEAYRDLSRGVALKGFRKGKVPRPVLEQVYGPRVNAEVAVQLVRESFFHANSEHKLWAVAEPRVDEGGQIKKGQPFAYAATVEVRGQIEPQNYAGLAIERRRLAVSDESVATALEALRKDHTELVPIEGRTTTQAGDVLALSVNGNIGEHPVSQPRFGIDLDPSEDEPLPGLRARLTGIAIDTKDLVIELDVPADFRDENLRGRHAKLTCSIVEARAKDIPELDDEFAKDTGKGETLDALRAAVRTELETAERDQIAREARQGALRELIKGNQIPVAASLVERAVEMQFQRLRSMLGMPPSRDATAGLSPELREKMRPAGADEVRGQLVLESIAEKEGMTVSDEELHAHVVNAAKQRNTTPTRLRSEWERDGRLDNVRFQLRQEKVLEFLVSRASITEVDKLTTPAAEEGADTDLAALPAHGAAGHVHGPDCDHDHG